MRILHAGVIAVLIPAAAVSQVSAPISDLHYDVTIDSAGASAHRIGVVATCTVGGPGVVILSLPGWTPGAYEMAWFARWVSDFAPTGSDGHALTWDKTDYETWRIDPGGSKSIRVAFTYEADTLDNAMSWTRPDFAQFNGTNLFLYPVGRGFTYPATVTVHVPPGWLIETGMFQTAMPNTYTAPTYHDLVDMPFFVGHFDVDSEQVSGKWVRYVSYPAGIVSAERRARVLEWLRKEIPTEIAVFHDTPWPNYTVMQITDSSYGGASGLEHQDSHVDIVGAPFLDNAFMPGLYAHEIFHSWNVKRLRPADMTPYRYDAPQPTPWLWVSEGITDYYADLAQVRGGVIPDSGFYALTEDKVGQVAQAPPTALTDASLTTWIHPTDGTQYVYYPKGSLAGFMLDVLIRDGSNNRASLDSVMRELYQTTYRKGRGFTGSDWWGAVSRAEGGRSFAEFNRRYIDGRDPFPLDSILPLAGLRTSRDTIQEPRLGIYSGPDSAGVRVERVEQGSAADAGGVRAGDVVEAIGDIQVTDVSFVLKFRAKYGAGAPAGTMLPVRVRRNGAMTTLQVPLRYVARVVTKIVADPSASPKAVRIRNGILHGTIDS